MSKILGIDLGTTNSAMAIIEGGQPKVLEKFIDVFCIGEGEEVLIEVVDLLKNSTGLTKSEKLVK